MIPKRDYYQILSVARSASRKEIQAAYRRLARQYHPDVTGGDKAAEERFKEINAAHEVLSDNKKRAAYDRWGDQWPHAEQLEQMQREREAGGFGAPGRGDGGPVHFQWPRDGDSGVFTDIGGEGGFGPLFDRLFRAGAGATGPQAGATIEHRLTVSLAEAFHGATRTVQVQTQDGRSAGKRLEVTIPPGVETGSTIRLRGKGAPGSQGGPPGDVVLHLTVAEDPRFARKGSTLTTEIRVSLTTAVLGGEATVPTLSGPVALRIPPGTQNGQTFRLAGKGMPVLHSDRHGDLLARVAVVLPQQIPPEMRVLFEHLRDLEGGAAPGHRDG